MISVSDEIGNLFKTFSNQKISISYSFDAIQSFDTSLNYYISGNYTQDKNFMSYFERIQNIESFLLLFSIPCENYNFRNCLEDNQKYCYFYYDESLTDCEKLNNFILIRRVFDLVGEKSLKVFFKYLNTLFKSCEFDYSAGCNIQVINSLNIDLNLNGTFMNISKDYDNQSYVIINNIKFYSSNYLEKDYCLSKTSKSDCEQIFSPSYLKKRFLDQYECSPKCYYYQLQNNICYSFCSNYCLSLCGCNSICYTYFNQTQICPYGCS